MVCQVFGYTLYRFMNSRHSVIYALLLLLNYIFVIQFLWNYNRQNQMEMYRPVCFLSTY